MYNAKQIEADKVFDKIHTLNFNDYSAVMRWIRELYEITVDGEVELNLKEVADRFLDENVKHVKFDIHNKEDFARYTMKLCAETIYKEGLISRGAHDMAKDWYYFFEYDYDED